MTERGSIIGLWRRGGASVLVTLVRVEGSSYRSPGARLLVGERGEFAGTISGGCLEGEVVQKAGWRVREGAVVERFSTLFDDTADIPFGLGCGGTVDLLMEPADTAECGALLQAMERAEGGVEARVVTWLPGGGQRLSRAVFAADGAVLYASEGLEEKEVQRVRENSSMPGEERIYVERLEGAQRLFVLGAGDDARPLVSMAALLGWRVTVAEGRAGMARAVRFPEAERVMVVNDVEGLEIAARDAVVIMTHSYEQDRELLAGTLEAGPRYLGLLGARHRSSLLIAEVAARMGRSVEACCAGVWAPVGLDLGGEGPTAIALAVLAEAQACCMGKLGTSRRLSAADVAEQVARGGVSHYLQTHCATDGTMAW